MSGACPFFTENSATPTTAYWDVLRDLHYRINRLELLLLDLATNQVNFDAAYEAGLWISEQIIRIETDVAVLKI